MQHIIFEDIERIKLSKREVGRFRDVEKMAAHLAKFYEPAKDLSIHLTSFCLSLAADGSLDISGGKD